MSGLFINVGSIQRRGRVGSLSRQLVSPVDPLAGATSALTLRVPPGSTYNGLLIGVRHSVTGEVRGFGAAPEADANGNRWVDVQALLSFVGSASGFVEWWYDPSGNARHATQPNAALQPRIVNAGVLDTQNGRPAIFFSGSTWLRMPASAAVLGTSAYTFNCVFASTTNGGTILMKTDASANWFGGYTKIGLGSTVGGGNFAGPKFASVQNSGAWNSGSVDVNTGALTIGTMLSPAGGSNTQIFTNGAANTMSLVATEIADAGTEVRIGFGVQDSMTNFVGHISEVVAFSSSSINRQALERSQGAAFGITVT